MKTYKENLLILNLNSAIDMTNTSLTQAVLEEQRGSVGINDLAYSISEIVKEHWGKHNYQAFKDVIKSELGS